jgi:hypothetical protein
MEMAQSRLSTLELCNQCLKLHIGAIFLPLFEQVIFSFVHTMETHKCQIFLKEIILFFLPSVHLLKFISITLYNSIHTIF